MLKRVKLNYWANFYILHPEMPKYAVAKGRKVGIYDTWDDCKKQVEGFTGAKYKKFDSQKQAEDFIIEFSGMSPKKSNSSTNNLSSFENIESHKAFPVNKISPSNIVMNDLNKNIKLIETKLSSFMNHVNTTFEDIKKRLSALEEKKLINVQTLRLEAEDKEILENVSSSKGVKRKAEDEFIDLSDEDFINLNYDDEGNPMNSSPTQPSNSDKPLPEQKPTKLPKCKIIDEVDGYYGINQCIVNSRGFLINPFGAVVAYTDGACTNNGKVGAKAGIGVWFNHNHPRNVSAPVRGRATNNNAEIQAATAAIVQASKEGIRHMHIYTDSQFLINCITSWIYKWKRNDWKTIEGKPVKNKVELVELDDHINEFMDYVVWTYVKGHSGDIGNSAADELARRGALAYRDE